jgi:hypothetical protein
MAPWVEAVKHLSPPVPVRVAAKARSALCREGQALSTSSKQSAGTKQWNA